MKIKILFDNEAKNKNLHIGWGVSFLIGEKILFDTGEKGNWLIENMENLKVDINKIETVVISHDHWDHWGGLWDLLRKKKGIKVYICPNFSREFKEKADKFGAALINAEGLAEITQGVFSTGEITGAYHGRYMPEQALTVKTRNGLTVITGCAHPGVLKIVKRVRDKFISEPIYFVFGGFHLMESDKRAIEIVAENFKKMKIRKAGPTHCSGKIAEEIFKERYKKDFVPIKVGEILDV
ncbi:MAG: MBL fold metallo-hydrolase [Candidatus Omnitrophica bacterium]|nr:MBL fold metallo-hydrolase [Candidatus Omnitrophota bacterium]